jgi:hypothetical protein
VVRSFDPFSRHRPIDEQLLREMTAMPLREPVR